MPYKNGKIDMAGYGASTTTVKPIMKESNKTRLAKAKVAKKKRVPKPVGYRVQSPDQQEKTGMMGKQPVAVFPRLKGQR